MRQAQGSAILDRATELRDALMAERFNAFSLQPNGKDIDRIDAQGAIDTIVSGLQSKESNVAVGFYPVNTDTSKKRHTMPKRCL
jgi:hypothetical protein